jgi:simple sugar transport system ATP-binding protein
VTEKVPVAEARAVSKRFGPTVALHEVSLEVAPGTVHGLVGRNGAGKSTLVSILTGLAAADAGEVRFDGEPAPPLSDRAGWRRRVACVYQKSTVIGQLSVAENLFLHRQARGRGGLLSWGTLRRQATDLLAGWDLDVDVRQPAADLTVEQRQVVEIARALSLGSRFIILDEPTAQLDAQAIDRLFGRIRALRDQGVTFLFISHHLEEVYAGCDTVTVLRDARHVRTAPVTEVPQRELVAAMTGEATGLVEVSERPAPADRPVLEVEALTLPEVYSDVSFTVRSGEIVGLAGAGGSGKVSVAETIVGLRVAAAGTVRIDGTAPKPGSVPSALAAGLGFVPQDRHRQGLVPELSVAENATLTVPHRLGRYGMVSPRRRADRARGFIRDLSIVTAGPDQPVAALSGGNQQKVVMARALANEPAVLVLIQPTAGVDVKAKEVLLGAAEDAARRGAGVLVVSDELDDLRPADRVVVLFKGRVVADVPRGWRDHDMIAAMEGVSR